MAFYNGLFVPPTYSDEEIALYKYRTMTPEAFAASGYSLPTVNGVSVGNIGNPAYPDGQSYQGTTYSGTAANPNFNSGAPVLDGSINPDYAAGNSGDTVGGVGNSSGMGYDIEWGAPSTQTMQAGEVFSTPAGDYQAVDNGYGQLGLAPIGNASTSGGEIIYNLAHGEHHVGIDPNTGQAWYQQAQGELPGLYEVPESMITNSSEGQADANAQKINGSAQSMLVPMAESQTTQAGLSSDVFSVDTDVPDFVPRKILKTFCSDTTLNVYYSDGTIEKLENNVNCKGVSNTPDVPLVGSNNGATPNNTNDGTISEECQGNDLHVYYRVGGKMYSNINRNHPSCGQSAPTTSSTSFGPGSNFGASGPGTVNSGFEYTPFQAKDPIEKQQSVDYVKMLRGFLTNSLFKDFI